MASSPKRASMREGPLAALFRKTEEEGLEPRDGDAPGAEAPAPATPAGERPHPSLAEPVAPLTEEDPRIPTPQERLRSAFSSDLPDDVMAPPEPPRSDARGMYARDVYAASEVPAPLGPGQRVGSPVIRVVGVGGAGVNAVDRMVEAEVEGVEFIAVNTDVQSLEQSDAHVRLHIGERVTRGLGSGANPDLGRSAAMEEYDKIKGLLKGSDMIFVTAGAGGGTGTGAAPVVARIAREVGALTVGIVTKPFMFEGSRRREQADSGVDALAAEVDTLIVVPNNRLLSVLERGTSMVDAFAVADDVLRQGVQGISDLVTLPGLINLDFADVRTIMSEAGSALLGIGMGSGERRAIDAAEKAVSSPLLETSMEGARKILLSITAGGDLSLWEVNEAMRTVGEAAHPEANIIFGATVDERLSDQVWITVVATGYDDGRAAQRRPLRAESAPAPRERERDRVRDRDERDRFGAGSRERLDRLGARMVPEPAGEPRVRRVAAPLQGQELDVPEFMPRR